MVSMKRRWYGLIAATSLFACGRSTALHWGDYDLAPETRVVGPWSDAEVSGATPDTAIVDWPRDAGFTPPDAPLDAASVLPPAIDANLFDAQAYETAGDDQPGAPPTSCGALEPLADMGVFTSRRSEGVIFSPDRSWMVLRVHVEDQAGVAQQPALVRIALPSGDETVLSDSGGTAEALGPSSAILLTGMGSSGTDMVVYDDQGLRTLATGICDHAATADGSRIYAVHDCTDRGIGSLEVIDVKTSDVEPLATLVVAGTLAVAPSGDWLACVVETFPDPYYRAVHLVSVHGDDYALSAGYDPTYLRFVSEDRLLFTTSGTPYSAMSHIRSQVVTHVLGSGTQATILSTNTEIGLFGYRISSAGDWLLLAQSQQIDGGPVRPALLLANHFDEAKSQTITSNLISYWDYQVAINAFAFSAVDDRVVYASYDDGLWSYSLSEGTSRKLSIDGRFVMSPTRAEVAILETDAEAGTGSSLHLLSLDSGADVISFRSDTLLRDVQFLPDGRGLLFTETRQLESTSSGTLRFISSAHPDAVVLAQWNTTLLSSSGPGPHTYPTGSYPVDPTGCFTIADVDGSPGPGTRLILLPE